MTLAAPAGDAEDPLGLRHDAPLFDAYLRARGTQRTPFTIPGHKGRPDLVGPLITADVPLHGGLDTIRLDHGTLRSAEVLAAALWGADHARFSVGGSTHGNQAVTLAVGRPGDRVVVARTLHRSLWSGLVLAGLEPIWVRPRMDPASGLPGAVDVDAVRDALHRAPDARAVFVGDPSYVGGTGDVAGLAEVAHAHGIPLVVDAAWGAHFGFHPDLPTHAIAAGADAVVTSAHKTLPAWSQGAIVLLRTERLDPDRFDRAFDMGQSTSPAGAILASIDASRALLQHHGRRLLDDLLHLVRRLRAELAEIPGLEVVTGDATDPAKVVLRVDPDRDGTPDGFALDAALRAAGAPVELTDRTTLIPMVTMADDRRSVDLLVRVLQHEMRTPTIGPRGARHDVPTARSATVWDVPTESVVSPRHAAFADHETVAADRAVGRISAELIAPYPPGVPVLAPGERVTDQVLAVLRTARDEGARIAYAADPTLATVQVLTDTVPDTVPDTRPGGHRARHVETS